MHLLPKTSHARTVLGALAALFIFALVLAACGGDDDDGEEKAQPTPAETGQTADRDKTRTFVGKVEGTDANIAIQVAGDAASGYVCDGKKIWGSVVGDAKDGEVELADEDRDYVVDATVQGDTVSGEVTLKDGSVQSFSAEPAEGDAGLYQLVEKAEDNVYVGRWVRSNDGSVRGKVTTVTGEAAVPSATEVVGGQESVPPSAEPTPSPLLFEGLKCRRALKAVNTFTKQLNDAGGADSASDADLVKLFDLQFNAVAFCGGDSGVADLVP